MTTSLRRSLPALLIAFLLGLATSPANAAEAQVAGPPPGTLSLTQAIAAALSGSPALSPFAAELRVRDAELVQASLRPNPELEVEQENFAGTGTTRAWNAAETTLALQQVLELGGKRERRVTLAELDRRLTEWDYAQARREAVLATAQAFVRTLAAQERVARARELVEVEESVRDSVARGVRAGAISPVDERRAALGLARATSEVQRLTRDLEAARIALAATWGQSEPSFDAVRGELVAAAPPPKLDELLSRAEALPEIARWGSEVERREAAVALEEARSVPDITVGAGVRHLAEDGDVAVVAQVGIPLPLFDRNQGAIEAARHAVAQARSQGDAVRVSRRAEIRALHQEMHSAYEQSRQLGDSLLPEAEAVYRDAREAYQRGLFRLTDVLDTQRALFELRLERLEALETYQRAAVALQAVLEPPMAGTSAPSDGGRP